jgi:quercetin dioxygenase-like cupin family protein
MMNNQLHPHPAAAVLERGEGRPFEFWGVQVRVLVRGKRIRGNYTIIEYTAPPTGMGPPVHYHRGMDESFYVLEGRMNFLIGEKRIVAAAGDFFHIPPGLAHAFWNTSEEPARMIVTFSPGGFEELFADLAEIATDFPIPNAEARTRVTTLDEKYDQIVVAPPPGRSAHRNGN